MKLSGLVLVLLWLSVSAYPKRENNESDEEEILDDLSKVKGLGHPDDNNGHSNGGTQKVWPSRKNLMEKELLSMKKELGHKKWPQSPLQEKRQFDKTWSNHHSLRSLKNDASINQARLEQKKRLLDKDHQTLSELEEDLIRVLRGREKDKGRHNGKGKEKSEKNDEKHEKELEKEFIFFGNKKHKERVRKSKNRKARLDLEVPPPVKQTADTRRGFGNFALWTNNEIPYEIATSTFNADQINKLETWVAELNTKTCVQMVPRTSQSQYLNIKGNDSGCWSYIGRTNIVPQPLSLSISGCVYQSVFEHEVGHAMGMFHEQSRSDRDNYVTIHLENVRDGAESNFDKETTLNLHPYDLSSVMHYGSTSFSTDSETLKTITVNDDMLSFLIDQDELLSYYDIRDINARYDCTVGCASKACQNGAYVDHTCQCACPSGLTGEFCDQPVDHNEAQCGEWLIDITDGSEKVLQTANFPGEMPTGYICTWVVQGVPGDTITATIESMQLAAASSCVHSLEIRYNLMGQSGPKICNSITTATEFVTTTEETPELMFLKLDASDSSTASTGFRITFKSANAVPQTTQAPTTQEPTTQAPTTQEPTTQAPTTQQPTTQAPTTQQPTTQAPTTQQPTTQAPTTQQPTTQAPTTQQPTTQAPTTQQPTTQAPTTQQPTTQAPTTQQPTTQAPTTQQPTTQAPTTQQPTTQAPTTQQPTTQAPTTQQPTTQAPTTQQPTTQAPTTQQPTTQAPTTQQPTTQAPTTQEPIPGTLSGYLEPCSTSENCISNLQCQNSVCTCTGKFDFYWEPEEEICTARICHFEFNANDGDCEDFIRPKERYTLWGLYQYYYTYNNNMYTNQCAFYSAPSYSSTSSLETKQFYEAGNYCVDFYYILDAVEFLRVIVKTESGNTNALSTMRSSQNGWTFKEIEFSTSEKFMLTFKAKSSGYGYLLLDDLYLYKGPCYGQK